MCNVKTFATAKAAESWKWLRLAGLWPISITVMQIPLNREMSITVMADSAGTVVFSPLLDRN